MAENIYDQQSIGGSTSGSTEIQTNGIDIMYLEIGNNYDVGIYFDGSSGSLQFGAQFDYSNWTNAPWDNTIIEQLDDVNTTGSQFYIVIYNTYYDNINGNPEFQGDVTLILSNGIEPETRQMSFLTYHSMVQYSNYQTDIQEPFQNKYNLADNYEFQYHQNNFNVLNNCEFFASGYVVSNPSSVDANHICIVYFGDLENHSSMYVLTQNSTPTKLSELYYIYQESGVNYISKFICDPEDVYVPSLNEVISSYTYKHKPFVYVTEIINSSDNSISYRVDELDSNIKFFRSNGTGRLNDYNVLKDSYIFSSLSTQDIYILDLSKIGGTDNGTINYIFKVKVEFNAVYYEPSGNMKTAYCSLDLYQPKANYGGYKYTKTIHNEETGEDEVIESEGETTDTEITQETMDQTTTGEKEDGLEIKNIQKLNNVENLYRGYVNQKLGVNSTFSRIVKFVKDTNPQEISEQPSSTEIIYEDLHRIYDTDETGSKIMEKDAEGLVIRDKDNNIQFKYRDYNDRVLLYIDTYNTIDLTTDIIVITNPENYSGNEEYFIGEDTFIDSSNITIKEIDNNIRYKKRYEIIIPLKGLLTNSDGVVCNEDKEPFTDSEAETPNIPSETNKGYYGISAGDKYVNVSNELNNIFIYIPISENYNAKLDSSTAVDVTSNSVTDIDFINNGIKLFSEPIVLESEEFIDIQDGAGGILCASFKKKDNYEESDWGALNVYYGTDILLNGDLYLRLNDDHTSHDFEYNGINTLYYTFKVDNMYLYVYIHGLEGITLTRKIHILLSAPGTQSTKSSTNDGTIKQEKIVLHELEINLPLVTNADTIKYIDSTRNGKTHHYDPENITEVETEFGKKFYGVRAYKKKYKHTSENVLDREDTEKYFPVDIINLGINGLTYNVPAKIVLLNPIAEQRSIYSFKNGEQYLTLDQTKIGLYPKYTENGVFTGDWDRINNTELLPSYKFSYSYLVEGLVPSEPERNYNMTFLNLVKHDEYKKLENNENVPGSAYIQFQYISTKINNTYTYVNLTNDGSTKRITSTVYTEHFEEYTENELNNLSEEDKNNIYEKTEEYTKLAAASIKFEDFYKIVNESTDETKPESRYYKYINNLDSYIPYKQEDLSGLKSVPLNLYTLSYVYRKISPDEIGTHKEVYYMVPNYVQFSSENNEITGEEINQTRIDPIYYKYNNTYIPYRNGFIKDGSVKYYGYKYSPITKEWIDKYDKNISNHSTESNVLNRFNNSIYVKHNYKSIGRLDKQTFIDYYTNGIKLYEKTGNVKYVSIDQNANIYIIDISGNTIYADTNKNVIPLETIAKKYYELTTNTNTGSNTWTNIEKESINNADPDDEVKNSLKINSLDFDGQKIKYILDFSGEYLISSQNISTYKEENQIEFFIQGNAYIKLDLTSDVKATGEYELALDNFLNNIKDYKTELYKFGVDKLDVNDLLLIDENFGRTPWHDATEYISIWLYDDIYSRPTDGEVEKSTTKIGKIDTKYINNKLVSTGLIINEDSNNIDINNYYYKDKEYEQSADIHMSKNKNYYEYTNKITTLGNYFGPKDSEIFEIKEIKPNQDDEYKFESYYCIKIKNQEYLSPTCYWDIINPEDITYYTKQTTYYTYSPNDFEVHTFSEITDNHKYSSQNYKDSIEGGEPDNVLFLKSRYFYNTYTFNNGLNISRDGSYYTNISVFDGSKGKAYKTLFLSSHIYTVTRYTYMYEMEDYFSVTSDADLTNILPERYSDYYVKDSSQSDEYIQLSEYSNSPAYYKNEIDNGNTNIELTTRRKYYATSYYEGLNDITDGEDGVYQMFDRYISEPVIIKHNNNLYGLIFLKNPYDIHTSSSIIIDSDTENFVETKLSDYIAENIDTSQIVDISTEGLEEREKDNITISNELYYNDYSNKNITTQYKVDINYYLNEYDFEIIEVKPTIFRDNQNEKVTIQDRNVKTDVISVEKPFTINNEKKVEFTGTYSWVKPKFGNITGNDNKIKEVILEDGYWKKDYEIKTVPFDVASYNFYPKDSVSSINITYNFIPNSYILTANIEHPEISYEYMVNEMEEKERYSYIINGFEYEYPVDKEVTFENGTYYGIISEHVYTSTDGDQQVEPESDENVNIKEAKVKLYKRKELSIATKVKNIIHQSKFNSYEYFTYNQATPLTNEKVPILYNTELIPATSKKVQFWDSTKNSYSIKTVIDSYAYYSYKYIYDTIPFKVASYIFTDPLSIGNFTDLGTYVSSIGEVLGESIGDQKESIDKLTYDLSNKISTVEESIDELSYKSRYDFNRQSDSLIGYIDTLNSYVYDKLGLFNDNLNENISNFTYVEEKAIDRLTESVSTKIQEQHDTLKVGLDHSSKVMQNKFEELNETIHEDLIGEGSSKNITTKYESVTYTPIYGVSKKLISGYKISRNTGEEEVRLGGSSLGEILSNSFSTTMEYTKTTEHEDGSYTMTTYHGVVGLGEILSNLTIQQRIPNYNEFMVDLVPKLFSSVDFEGDYDIVHDVNGNVIEKKKRNPTDLAKKCIMRADVLWGELKKKGIVS